MTESAALVQVIEETPAYRRVVFDYPPFNIVDAVIFEALQDLIARMNASTSLRVVVFESANPKFYLAHFDLTGKIGNIMTAVGPSGLPILMDTFVRLTRSAVVSIARDPRLRPGRAQRVRPCLRHALRVAREHAIGPARSRGRIASWRRWYVTPSTSGRPCPGARRWVFKPLAEPSLGFTTE